MDLYLTLLDVSNLFTISVLFSLSIYHILIFLGRIYSKSELYNLYFSLFAFSLSVYILLNTSLSRFISVSINFKQNILPPLQLICSFGIVFGISNLLINVLNYPKNKKWIFYSYYLSILISILLTFLNFILGYQLYFKNIYPFIIIIFHMPFLLLILCSLIDWVLEKKLYKDKIIKIIFSGSLLFLVYFMIEKILYFSNIRTLFKENYLVIAITNFIFAYALAQKFNIEHKDLIDLKENLEKKVKERTIEVELAKREVEELIKQKSNFFVNLTHEIKTPLTLIRNYLNDHVIKKIKTNEAQLIKYNFDKLTRDIINYLDFEKLERNQVFYNHNQLFNFSKLLEMKIKLFIDIAEKKNIKINYDIKDNLYLMMDSYAADRIINNLIDNAIKYTDKDGEINILLKKENNKVILVVSDNGIGISSEQLVNIFKPYHQLSHKKRNIQGIGMGLSIVKNILNSINSEIIVESELDKGTTFTIYFNRLSNKNKDMISDEIEYSNPIESFFDIKIINKEYDKNKYNILMVEDNYELLAYLINKLNDEYNVFYATNGKAALDKIKVIPVPNVIISDIMMDEMDGYEFFDKINSNIGLTFIPFIFLTAKSTSDEKLKGLSKGAMDFIYKPFNFEELLNKIRAIIKNQTAQKENNLKSFKIKVSKILRNNTVVEAKYSEFYQICEKYNINPREQEVVKEIINGCDDYKEVGNKLNVSINTIKKHIQNIFKKIKVQNKMELIKFFRND